MSSDTGPKIIQVPQISEPPRHICERCTAGIKQVVGFATATADGRPAVQPMRVTACAEGYYGARDAVTAIIMECAQFEEEGGEEEDEQPVPEQPGGLRDVSRDARVVADPGSVVDPDDLSDEDIDSIQQTVIEQTKNDPNHIPVGGEPRKN